MALLTCRDLAVGYDRVPVYSNLNFTVDAGDYLCIIGENGSGKTTLMKTLLGLNKPVSGQIIRSAELSASKIGYLPQQEQSQKDFPASVWEIVLSGRQGHRGFRPFYSEKDRSIALKNLKRLHIDDLRKKSFRELSGGQQQRVLLARALSAASEILLLDEPVAGLDPDAAANMYELIRELNAEDGVAIIMVSHDMEAAEQYASHILRIGKEPFFGTKEDYLRYRSGSVTRRSEEDSEYRGV